MDAPTSNPPLATLPALAADVLSRVRARGPRVHCLTNAVAQNFTANVLLAAGAVPSMTAAPEEIAQFVAHADALLINLGTLDRERREAAGIAVEVAGRVCQDADDNDSACDQAQWGGVRGHCRQRPGP